MCGIGVLVNGVSSYSYRVASDSYPPNDENTQDTVPVNQVTVRI